MTTGDAAGRGCRGDHACPPKCDPADGVYLRQPWTAAGYDRGSEGGSVVGPQPRGGQGRSGANGRRRPRTVRRGCPHRTPRSTPHGLPRCCTPYNTLYGLPTLLFYVITKICDVCISCALIIVDMRPVWPAGLAQQQPLQSLAFMHSQRDHHASHRRRPGEVHACAVVCR